MAGEEDVLSSIPPQREGEYSYSNAYGGPAYGGRWRRMGADGRWQYGTAKYEEEADRSRLYGDLAAGRQAYQPTKSLAQATNNALRAQQSRGEQYGALREQQGATGLARAAAMGEAPSQAQLLGRNMIDQSLQAQMAGASSARGGGLAQAAAMRAAANQAAAQQQQGTNQLAALRAQEMAQARDQYAQASAAQLQGASGIRGQDYQGQGLMYQHAQIQSANENAQRQMNDAQRRFFESQAQGVYQSQLNAELGGQQQSFAQQSLNRQMDRADADRQQQYFAAALGGASTFGAGAMSDMRAKEPLSLASVAGGGIVREDPYAGIIRENPYEEPPMVSDERAKREAFLEGAAYGMNPRREVNPATGQPYLPSYMHKDNPKPDADVRDAEWRRQQQFKREAPANLAAVAQANRSMQGSPYAYKPGMTPPGQAPGEPNVGPMAQQMEQSPVAATAVKVDPATGYRFIDRDKALKVTMSGVAALQQQLDQLKASKQ